MAASQQDLQLLNPLGDDHMITNNDSTKTDTSVTPTNHTNSPNLPGMSRTGSGAGSLRLLSPVNRPSQPTASGEFKAQLSYPFRYLYTTLQETKAEFHIATQSFSERVSEGYSFLQLTESSLARDETIVEADLLEGHQENVF